MYDPHEPHDGDDGDDNPYELHERLAVAISSMLCAALLPRAEATAAHKADMLIALDLIALEILQHNFSPAEVQAALKALMAHNEHVAKAFVMAASTHGVACEVEVHTELVKRPAPEEPI